jgi:DinB superfamily
MATFTTLERQRKDLLNELSQWTPQRLAFQGGLDEWSALQMLDHLIRTEREILVVVYRNENASRRLRLSDRLRNSFLKAVFRSDRKVKTPASASLVLPGEDLVFPALVAQWNEVRDGLALNIDRLLVGTTGKALFHHPVGGWMDMARVLDFLSVHLVHRGFQLQRLRAASLHLQAMQIEEDHRRSTGSRDEAVGVNRRPV